MPVCIRSFLLCPLLAVLVGCGDGRLEDQEPVPEEVAAVGAPAVSQAATHGGDGSQIELLSISAAQLETVELPGELACAFEAPAHGTLLVARADVLPDGAVRAVLNNNGYVEMLANGRAGGFNDLLDGTTLAGKGLTVTLARGADQQTGNESTRHAATLTVRRADGAERTYDGTWTCGP